VVSFRRRCNVVDVTRVIQQESRAVYRETARCRSCSFQLKVRRRHITSLRTAKLRKPGFRTPIMLAQNRIQRKMRIQSHPKSRARSQWNFNEALSNIVALS